MLDGSWVWTRLTELLNRSGYQADSSHPTANGCCWVQDAAGQCGCFENKLPASWGLICCGNERRCKMRNQPTRWTQKQAMDFFVCMRLAEGLPW
jgi:hypothetical protein